MKVFLSGEGPDELGDLFKEPQYRGKPPLPGLLHALLEKKASLLPEIVGARIWKRIRKFRLAKHGDAETHNVLGLLVEADEVGADVLVFVRDQDGDEERERAVKEGIRLAREDGRFHAKVAGGVAVQEIEAWLLAMLGERRSEDRADPKTHLRDHHGVADREGKIRVVENATLNNLPPDANSLRDWLHSVEVALETPV